MKELRLQPGRERRILQGHRWVFGNEVAGRLTDHEPGEWMEIVSSKGVPLGSGYINPHSLIVARIICPPGSRPDEAFFRELFVRADALRKNLYPGSACYRAVFGESDGLPGLVVDRYDNVVVYQVTTLGMAAMEPLMRDLLMELYHPEALVFRNDVGVRTLEGLSLEKGTAVGLLPEDLRVDVDGVLFRVDPLKGQKTGLFLDQRDNRRALGKYVAGKSVLDLFCYNGGWSLSAALAGAARVVGVDESGEAVAHARENAGLNGVSDRCDFVEAEVFHHLRTVEKGEFDVVVLDPPAFAKSKSSLNAAAKGYTDLNRRALSVLKSGGILVTCSCSRHMNESLFRESLLQASQAAGKRLRVLETRGQAGDHPTLLAMPETDYLKCLFLEVM